MQDYEKAYTIKEFSELTGVPQNTLRNWEEKLEEAFIVPRDPQGNRFYTELHTNIVNLIQEWRDSKYEFSFLQIKEMLLRLKEQGSFQGSTNQVEEGSQLGLELSKGNGTQQLQQMQQMVTGIEDRMQQFFGQLTTVLNQHSESTQNFLKNEIENLRSDQEARDNKVIQGIEDKLNKKFEEENTAILDNVNEMKKELNASLEASKNDSKELMNTYIEEVKKGIAEKIEGNMQQWAVITKEDLAAMRQKKKKRFLGLFGRED
ncbi:MAG: MerR family transcriptional regulator [Candidatus Pristimantibacillus sp.]